MHTRNTFRPTVTVALALLLLAGCATQQSRDDSLYRELGGMAGIETLVDGLLFRISEDSRIVDQFADADPGRLHRTLSEQICVLAGGPCEYTGDDMVTVHTGRNISEASFNALVEDLVDVMEHQRIPVRAQNRLLAKLAPLRGEIIGL